MVRCMASVEAAKAAAAPTTTKYPPTTAIAFATFFLENDQDLKRWKKFRLSIGIYSEKVQFGSQKLIQTTSWDWINLIFDVRRSLKTN